MKNTHRWTAVAAAAALTLTACGDDASSGDSSAGTGDDPDDVREQLAAEAEELGVELTDEELDDAEQLLTGDGGGSATVVIDGETIDFPGTSCYQGSEWWAVEALHPEWGDVQVRFSLDYRPDAEPGTYRWDAGDIRLLRVDHPILESPWGQDGPIVGDESSARGSGIVWDNNVDLDDREATSVEVELEITCAG